MDAERKTTRCPLEKPCAAIVASIVQSFYPIWICWDFWWRTVSGGAIFANHIFIRFMSLSLSLPLWFPHSRMLTFCYLVAFNWWLVLCPSTLSHDWQMGSIPLLTSLSDPRNMLTLWAFLSAILMLHKSVLDFEVNIVVAADKFVSVASELWLWISEWVSVCVWWGLVWMDYGRWWFVTDRAEKLFARHEKLRKFGCQEMKMTSFKSTKWFYIVKFFSSVSFPFFSSTLFLSFFSFSPLFVFVLCPQFTCPCFFVPSFVQLSPVLWWLLVRHERVLSSASNFPFLFFSHFRDPGRWQST